MVCDKVVCDKVVCVTKMWCVKDGLWWCVKDGACQRCGVEDGVWKMVFIKEVCERCVWEMVYATHIFVSYHFTHTPSYTHNLVIYHLSHPSFHTRSFTHNLVTHHLSDTSLSHAIFHTQFCHTPSFTHIFVTHHLTQHLSHTSLSHTIFHHFTKHLCQAAGYRNKNKNPTQRFGGINIHREKYWK